MQIQELLHDPKCLVVCNHSGGKDSQAMYLRIRALVPANRLVVIHATLGEVEWPDSEQHIIATTSHEFFVVKANKTLFEMAEHRGMWPSPKNRQCTSDLKRGPIAKKIVSLCNERGFDKVLNCIGLRAQESSGRAKKSTFRLVESNTNGKRRWFEWLPIHEMTTKEVFASIAEAGQKPHWAYAKGMTRLSCCFCIMSSREDLKTAKALMPDLYQKYLSLERLLNHTLIMPGKDGAKFLDELLADAKTLQMSLFDNRQHQCRF